MQTLKIVFPSYFVFQTRPQYNIDIFKDWKGRWLLVRNCWKCKKTNFLCSKETGKKLTKICFKWDPKGCFTLLRWTNSLINILWTGPNLLLICPMTSVLSFSKKWTFFMKKIILDDLHQSLETHTILEVIQLYHRHWRKISTYKYYFT